MIFSWTYLIIFYVVQNVQAQGKNSFVVRAGYGVQENQNNVSYFDQVPQQSQIINNNIIREKSSDDVIYGNKLNSFQNNHHTNEEHDPEKPSLNELQNLIKKIENSHSNQIVRVLKVPAVYEIHMHSNSKGLNEDYVKVPQEHFGKLKLNKGYMSKLQNTFKNYNDSTSLYKNRAVQRNLRNVITEKPRFNYNKSRYQTIPKQYYDNKNYDLQTESSQNTLQYGGIVEVPAPTFGKYPHPQPFIKAHKTHIQNLPTNFHKKAQYAQNNILPDLSLYYNTKDALDKGVLNEHYSPYYNWESGRIKSRSGWENNNRKMRSNLRAQRRISSPRANVVYPAMKFVFYTFEGD